MAAALRRKVYFMAGVYRGGNRYAGRVAAIADGAREAGLGL